MQCKFSERLDGLLRSRVRVGQWKDFGGQVTAIANIGQRLDHCGGIRVTKAYGTAI